MPAPVRHSAPDVQLLRDLLLARSGIDFGRHREILLENSLRRRMREVGARSLYEYYRMLTAPGSAGRELQVLVDEISIHETSFFRNAPQFQLFEREVLPERTGARISQGRRTLRLWSAGCSTGQEAYSMAVGVLENAALTDAWDVQLWATDISAQALQVAKRGEYTSRQVEGVSAARLQRFFRRHSQKPRGTAPGVPDPSAHADGSPRENTYVVRDWARKGLRFVLGSVLDGAPFQDLDAIFCRNVMIYFDRRRQERLMALLTRALTPGGYLFLGHAETPGSAKGLRMVSRGLGIAYQRWS
ncbi:MAG: CheR family methyltransferase [Vicinamibacteria bacterium]